MVDYALSAQLKSNDILMESFHEMRIAQEGKDRIGYIDVVTEAFSDPTKQAGLLNKLYKEIQKVEEIDFGKIPDSKGDISKYIYYDKMYSCIEVLNELVEDKPTPNITTMNKLHQILLNARPDFTFGFKTDNFIIITSYNVMVTALYEMINICIVDATEYLRNKLNMNPTTPTPKQIRWITKNANQFIKLHESGQWNILMKNFKSNDNSITVASEAIGGSLNLSFNTDAESSRGQLVKNAGNAIINGITKIPGAINSFRQAHPKITIVAALIAAFIAIRSIIYYGINCAGKISDRLKNIASVLKANAASETSPTALEKQKKMLDTLDNLSDTIDYKIIKSEKAAEKNMKDANKNEFNPQEITNISGSDFEI